MKDRAINLHFFLDEKVVSRTISYFEKALPGKNRYVIIIPYQDYQCKYVKTDCSNISCVVYNTKEFWNYVGDVSQYNNIIIHYLTDKLVDFILKHRNCNYTWIVWGGDLFTDLLVYLGYDLYSDPKQIDSIIKKMSLRYCLTWYLSKIKRNYLVKKRIAAIKLIPNICLDKYSQKILEYYLPFCKETNFFDTFFYYPIDDIVPKEMVDMQNQGKDIMVGNSATFSNNHLYVFDKLCNLHIGNRNVIVPMSYGENKEYVLEKGKELLGDNFCPLLDFMPLADYNRLLLNVGTFIYGHFRPEAYGNIIVALYSGATVFLAPNNPHYLFLKDLGMIVFSIDDMPNKIDYHLTDEERIINRTLIKKHYNKELLINNIQVLFAS